MNRTRHKEDAMENPQAKDVGFQQAAALVLLVGCIIMGSLPACSAPGPAAFVPTDSSPPGNTAAPAVSDIPTPSAYPRPTATRTPTADAAAEQTAFSSAILEKIKSTLAEAQEPMGEGDVLWAPPETIEIKHEFQQYEMDYRLIEAAEAADFAFHSTIRWASSPAPAKRGTWSCFVMFRISGDPDDDEWYRMMVGQTNSQDSYGKITSARRAEFAVMRGILTLKYNRHDDDRIGGYLSENEVLLIVRGTQWDLYVNGKQILVWWDIRLSEGGFGIGALAEYGSLECEFSDNWIWGFH
jgi:hypothetical protein